MRFITIVKASVVTAILSTAFYLVLQHNAERFNILVVHSYNRNLAWVNEVDDGIQRALNSRDRRVVKRISVRTHYMNLKKHPECNYYKNAASDIQFTIDNWQPHAVVIVDDLAQALVGFNQANITNERERTRIAGNLAILLSEGSCETQTPSYFGLQIANGKNHPSIVFAGVNGTVEPYGYELADNVSGIYEHKNYGALVETLTTLTEAVDEPVTGIQFLNDNSATAHSESENYLLQDLSPFIPKPPLNVETIEEWKQAVARASKDNVILLIANYQNVRDSKGLLVPSTRLIMWTEQNSKLPVLGANTSFISDGGMMTVAISGTEQGEVAMSLAIENALGNTTSNRLVARQFIIGMNQSLVRKRNLNLPGIYEAFSREVGQFVEVSEHLYMEQKETTVQ